MRLHNRLIRPGFWTDTELIQALPMPGRMYYMGLVQLSEDSGVVEDNMLAHKIHLFPGDMDVTPETVEGWRDVLVELGKLIPYEQDGKKCLFLKNFHKHQKLRTPAAPDLPLPPWVTWTAPVYEPDKEGRDRRVSAGFYTVGDPCDSDTNFVRDPYEGDTESVQTSYSREPELEPELELEPEGQTDRVPAREPVLEPDPLPEPFASMSVGQSSSDDLPDPHDDMALRDVADRYQHRIGIVGGRVMPTLDEWHTEHGLSYGVMAAAVDMTAEARADGRIRGSPDGYLFGVIRGLYNDGVRTVVDLQEKQRADPRSGQAFDSEASVARALERLDALDKAAGEG